jgi:hypothetical protein
MLDPLFCWLRCLISVPSPVLQQWNKLDTVLLLLYPEASNGLCSVLAMPLSLNLELSSVSCIVYPSTISGVLIPIFLTSHRVYIFGIMLRYATEVRGFFGAGIRSHFFLELNIEIIKIIIVCDTVIIFVGGS